MRGVKFQRLKLLSLGFEKMKFIHRRTVGQFSSNSACLHVQEILALGASTRAGIVPPHVNAAHWKR